MGITVSLNTFSVLKHIALFPKKERRTRQLNKINVYRELRESYDQQSFESTIIRNVKLCGSVKDESAKKYIRNCRT